MFGFTKIVYGFRRGGPLHCSVPAGSSCATKMTVFLAYQVCHPSTFLNQALDWQIAIRGEQSTKTVRSSSHLFFLNSTASNYNSRICELVDIIVYDGKALCCPSFAHFTTDSTHRHRNKTSPWFTHRLETRLNICGGYIG